MVRETRHLWVGNLPDNIREDRIREHFKRYGRVQSVKLLPRVPEEKTGEITMACTVAFMDIKSASKAHNAELKIDDRTLNTEYYEPAAIPSAASPQNTPSPYSTSPGATRFPNGHGSSDEHGVFPERFYDRAGNRVAPEGEFIRRTGYHDSSRGRNRDRNYRNGPYNNLIERHPRTLNNSWTYDSSRYNNTTNAGSQSETGYNTTPSDACSERRNSDQGTRKNAKSRSGSRSPSPEGSASSRSPSRSRSRSSSSSSSSSASRDTSSTGSPKSRRKASNQNSDDRRPVAICVKNLPLRSSDTSLKDGLFHEYKKHGKVTWVKVVGQNADRHAIVCFKKPEDVEKALEVSYDKLFFGCKIEVAPYAVCEVDDVDLRPYEADIDEYHPKATRTLFIGNLEKDVTASDLRKHFDQFGEIIEIDIKKQGAVSSYAFCQYSDIVSVVKAIRKMDGEHLGNNRIKLGFGKSMQNNCVWIDGVNENVTEKYLKMQFDPFGTVGRCIIDREKGQALVSYEQVLHAQQAVTKMRGFVLKNTKLQVDFASRECQECFFERLEKLGMVLDRTFFEEKCRDATSRSFDSTAVATRFSRYDTPTRPRTSSYSSRSSAAASQVTSAIPSPGTPGSVTPRGAGSRSRVARFYDYEQSEYPDRHFRSYDEYSQGSAASHEDTYEHEYVYAHESPTHLDPLEVRVIQTVVDSVPFAPPDIRNLQKERVHLLEQLEECPSSGDELISPKKRLKLELLDSSITSDVIIEANRDHRKVMEVRRLSDANLRHHSRRPSVDSAKYNKDLGHDRNYMPHAVGCKRRKTASSDSGSRVHHYDHSGSESVGGSRPGTPLCDEKPENFPPSEPRRVPRDRDGPLTLPLPKFAAQLMNRGSVSVAGIKGQKDATNILSSPPPAATSPRISNARPPSPVHVPPPASPPPRPVSLSSNSSDSGAATPPSPSLDERIRSLNEKYEKWSGSRALSAAGGDALALLDANREKFRLRHKLLDLDLKEVQPSEIVKSVMAKRSVFDEDLKRLENVGEKYEPKDFGLFSRTTTASPLTPIQHPPTISLPATSTLKLTSPVPTQLPKTPTMLSPRSTASAIPAAKGLQYPFPSHPPVQMSPVTLQAVPSPTTVVPLSPLLAPVSTSVATSTATTTTVTPQRIVTMPGENRLKPSVSAATPTSKVTVNRGGATPPAKTNERSQNVNIPSDVNASGSASTSVASNNGSGNKLSVKSSDKASDKITCRRDSNNSSSPRADVKTRRNSDTSARRIEDIEKFSDSVDKPIERAKSEERKRDNRLEKVKLENERLEREKAEKERIEKERIEKEKQEKERLERERLEKERQERESELEKQRLEKERLEKERLQMERLEKEKQEKEREEREKAKLEKERAEKERLERERLESERLEKEKLEKEKLLEQERLEKERQKEREEKEKKEKEERDRKEKAERERKDRERQALQEKELLEKQEKERKEGERKEREERERKEREEKELRVAEQESLEKELVEKEKQDKDRKREDDRTKHKEDNHHDKRKEDHKHRENHSETKHKENNIDKYLHDSSKLLLTKEDKPSKDSHEVHKKDSHASHDNSSHKNKHNVDKDTERRKESIKENRDNNIHDRHKNLLDTKDHKERAVVETRHMSIDLEKTRPGDSSKSDASRRKERNNSLPANLGIKRRVSSHEILESIDESKRIKLSSEHRKLSERRDSKDSSRSDDKPKCSSKHKNNHIKSHDKHNSTKDCDEKRKEKDKEREERHKKHKLEKQKSKSKSREKESRESPVTPKSPLTDKDFLAKLNLRANEDLEKEKQQRKEAKEKRKEYVTDLEKKDDKKPTSSEDKPRKEKEKDKPSLSMSEMKEKDPHKHREETLTKQNEERKLQKRERIKKLTNSTDSDSDEPRKHSIFDIVDDEPAYISMYDKVKARSCKNMQKQEEEKRQEKIKAKFSQLKQSRARREEKKRSTSWDEDSDSERDGEMKFRRCPKMLIDSSDESQERKGHKKRDTHSDSDNSMRQIKSEIAETTDDDIKSKLSLIKPVKSRIASDTSEDEYNKKNKLPSHINSGVFSENDQDLSLQDPEVKPEIVTTVKSEIERLIKKERRNSKFQEFQDPPVFGEYMSAFEAKLEKHNNKQHILENTTDDEAAEIKKERSERKEKKHKKKQKKQKHSTSDESTKMETDTTQSEVSEKKHHDKKKDHCRKEKKRDKTRDGREKSKKSKKTKSENKNSELKRDGKIENIFGSLSEDSETGVKESEPQKPSFLTDENAQHPLSYNSDTEQRDVQTVKVKEEKDREHEREEHKRRKEKRRREKERRLQEAAAAVAEIHNSNETSMDYADMAKQLEANIKDDTEEVNIKNEDEPSNNDTTQDILGSSEHKDEQKKDKEERKELKEKKKKRKKSKEEKSKHHHHHHHDKNKVKSPEIKKEGPLPEVKIEIPEEKTPTHTSQSLPSIFDIHSPTEEKSSPDFNLSPATRDVKPIISPIPTTPTTSKEKKRDKLIPGFGTEIDEKIHESAVKSISEFEPVAKPEEPVVKEDVKEEKPPVEEKPRVVISQEETEDAVAALLGESFGGEQFDECYTEEVTNVSDVAPNTTEENNVQDDEEMRQAVQSLSSGDLDAKPDTPQSEHDLQIDTDTEEQEETSVPLDQPVKTTGLPNCSSPLKVTEAPFFQEEKLNAHAPVIFKSTPNIGSPPSLTPIKPVLPVTTVIETKKHLEDQPKSLPMLPEQQQPPRTVISQSWMSTEKNSNSGTVNFSDKSSKPPLMTTSHVPALVSQSASLPTTTLKTYGSPITIKMGDSQNYPPLAAISKESVRHSPTLDQKVLGQNTPKSPNTTQLHNLPARSPVQISKPPISTHENLSPKATSSLNVNRLPITPVMVSKPLQPTTVILPQSKMAGHTLEPPKLVSPLESRIQERPRMVFQPSGMQPPYSAYIQGAPRGLLQPTNRHMPPSGLLVHTRHFPPPNFVGNIPPQIYNMSTLTNKDNIQLEKVQSEAMLKLSQPPLPPNLGLINTPHPQNKPSVVLPLTNPHPPVSTSTNSKLVIQQTPVLTCFKPNVSHSMSPQQPFASSVIPTVSHSMSPKPNSSPVISNVSHSIGSKPCASPVMSTSSQQSPKLMPVISEPQKLVVVTSTITEPTNHTPTIVQVTSSKSTTPVITQATSEAIVTHLTVPESGRTSTPSPVIVPNPMPEIKTNPITEVKDTYKPPSPVKLAIEKVTDELNMSLKKEVDDVVKEENKLVIVNDNKSIVKEQIEDQPKPKEDEPPKPETKPETVPVEDKTNIRDNKPETDLSTPEKKEVSNDTDLANEDPLDTKEDNDYWSAKEVNIDSVIKTLCSADELSEHGSDHDKDEWPDTKVCKPTEKEPATPEKKEESITNETKTPEQTPDVEDQRQETTPTRGGRGRGRGSRGRRGRGGVERGGIQTRRAKLSKEVAAPPATPTKRGRGGKTKNERKGSKSEAENAPSDVYEFKEDSDDNKEQRPRLVLTIKSSAASSTSNSHTTAIVKEITKDGAKEIGKESKEILPESPVKPTESKDEFASPQQTSNTRKSRRLQEKDISRNTVDDTIEDVVKNTIQTRASSNQRRSVRQGINKSPQTAISPQLDTPRKSPRGRKPRRGSEANSELSSSEETIKEEVPKPVESPKPPVPSTPPAKEPEKPVEPEKEKLEEAPKEKPFEGLKAAMLRRIKGELSNKPHEPTQLIDPVTGLLIPMRECEEGRYIPLPGSSPNDELARKRAILEKELGTSTIPVTTASAQITPVEPPKSQATVIAQPLTVVQQPVSKPQSLKAHVLSSQAAKAVVTQQVSTTQTKLSNPLPQQTVAPTPVHQPVVISKVVSTPTTSKIITHVITKPVTSMMISKTIVTPASQSLNINTSLPLATTTVTHSPRPYMPVSVTSKPQVKPPLVSPGQQVLLPTQQKQFVKQPQHVPKPQVGSTIPNQPQIVNTQMAHMKHQNVMKQVIVGKTPLGKPVHPLHQQVFSAQLATPPQSKVQTAIGATRIIQGPPSGVTKGVMEPPKVDVNLPVLGRPTLSPQGQARIGSLPVSGYEASLGEPIQGVHFPPAHLRLPPEINPAHYIHPHVMQYHQQLLRQQQLHLQRTAGLEKSGEEGEEAPDTSPPLELRRPGSVGLTVPGRAAAVPHSLHSPHDRATESPQMGQVYNSLHPTSRIPPYHPSQRYFDQTEPPPAHQRSMSSHGSLAALGSERGLAHMAPLGGTSTAHHQPDRGHPGHLQPDRPLSGHAMTAQGAHSIGHPVTPTINAQTAHTGHSMSAHMGGERMPGHMDRPLSAHGLMGAGLGAAGNLMGAVAKHIGADAPTSQRGLQAATPPHASQVPPQAESLFMLLKQYPLMWQGLLALKNDQAAVQMYFVSGNDSVAKCSLPKNTDGSTPPLRIFQRMRLEPPQVEGVARKMQMENEHCMLLALPCGHDHMDVLKQSTNLTNGFITYLQQKQAAGIVNVAAPGTTQPPAYVVHIFPSCDFVNENLRRIAPSLLERVADIAHLLIVITTV